MIDDVHRIDVRIFDVILCTTHHADYLFRHPIIPGSLPGVNLASEVLK
jgi:hypothetical protein